jgi:hypothetical protein
MKSGRGGCVQVIAALPRFETGEITEAEDGGAGVKRVNGTHKERRERRRRREERRRRRNSQPEQEL